MTQHYRQLAAIAVLLIAAHPSAAAQTGTITGRVVDADRGDGLPGAHVVALELNRGEVTDEEGHFRFEAVPPGVYSVRASFVGYEHLMRELEVRSDEVIEVVFELRTALYDEPIVIEGDRIRSVGRTRAVPRLIPQGVAVIEEELLARQGVQDVARALENVSGVAVETREQPFSSYTIRGLPADHTGTFRRNGIEIPHLHGRLRPNVTQVEVLKGPASVLYGRIEPGGVVNFVTRRPRCREPIHQLKVGGGTFADVRVGGRYEPNCVPDGPNYAFDALLERRGSIRDLVSEESAFVSGTAVAYPYWPPARLTVEAEYDHAGAVLDPGIALPHGMIGTIDRSTFFGEPGGRYAWRSGFVSAGFELLDPILSWSTGAIQSTHFRLAYGRYRHGRELISLDSLTAGEMVARSLRADDTRYEYLVAELSVDGGTAIGPVWNEFSAGLEGTRLAIAIDGLAPLENVDGQFRFASISPVSFSDPRPTGLPARDELIEYASASGSGWNVGLFAQNRASLGTPLGRLHGIAAARLARVSVGAEWFALAATPETPAGLNERHLVMTAITPSLGLVLVPAQPLSIYASWGTSFNPVFQQVDEDGEPFEPTRGEQYEVGLKVETSGISASLAAFDLRKRGALSLTPQGQYVQTGLQQSRGIEVDLSGSPTERLNILAALTLLEAVVLEDDVIPSGNRLPTAPSLSARLWASYDVTVSRTRHTVGIGFQYVGDRYSTLENNLLLSAHSLVDASITLRPTDRFEIQLSGRNLLDERYFVGGDVRGSGDGGLVVGWPGAPRSLSVKVRVDV